tara:strand:+ start:6426 stop:7601 length:1176 start_codon:yes stop_codon:yes gene_type:complete
MSNRFLFTENYENYPIIKIKLGSEYNCEYINNEERNQLLSLKNKIGNEEISKWDKAKKISNEYELIHLPSRRMKHESISEYSPLSRSYFKLWEMLHEHKLINNENSLNILCLAEGPGGFIEAIVNYRKRNNKYDNIDAITLKSTTKEIPGWDKSAIFLKQNPNINIHYGSDNTGDLYKLENIEYMETICDKSDLITADGGFDFSNNFNDQEHMSIRIILCEIVTALCCQKIGGTFVCKLFDLYTNDSISLIYLLKCVYSTVIIDKPLTSRPANSEKYIICLGFKGIDTNYLKKLKIVIKSWEISNNNNLNIVNIFDTILDNDFLNKINNLNTVHYNLQKENIIKTLSLINDDKSLEYLNNLIDLQIRSAVEWCNKYNVKVNEKSYFIKDLI